MRELDKQQPKLAARACRRVECGADKGGVFDTVLLDRAAETGAVGGLSVYVGDSASDLAPLTAADVGIVIGRNALLRRICAAAGLRSLPLSAGQCSCSQPPVPDSMMPGQAHAHIS